MEKFAVRYHYYGFLREEWTLCGAHGEEYSIQSDGDDEWKVGKSEEVLSVLYENFYQKLWDERILHKTSIYMKIIYECK